MRSEASSTTAALSPAAVEKMSQATIDLLENGSYGLSNTQTTQTYIPPDIGLAPEHQEYLMQRHGTLDLDPMPGPGSADPYNWPHWRKVVNLILVAIHAMMSTFTGAAIIPAFENISVDLGVSLPKTAYLTSLTIAILAVAPMMWRPLCDKYGRRPIFLLSLICSLVGNIGCAKSPTYATMALCRAIVMFFLCPPASVGSGVVTETFFRKDRARYIGVWTLMVTLGVPISPFIMGFVANNIGYRWIYWILAIINGVQFIAYFFFGPETRYIRTGADHKGSDFKQEYFNFTTIDPRPLTIRDFVHSLSLWRRPCITIPAVASAMVFVFASVLVAVELPQLFGDKFHFNAQQLGYQFIGLIVGSVIGEQFGGSISDYWMNRRAKIAGVRPAPEYRLWLSYVGFILTIIGVTTFLAETQRAKPLHWNITPVIGIAIGGAGNQIVTTVLITYAVDCYEEESASIGVFITLIRQMWGFLGPFWFPPMLTNVGVARSSIVVCTLILGVSIFPTMVSQAFGSRFRDSENTKVLDREQSHRVSLNED